MENFLQIVYLHYLHYFLQLVVTVKEHESVITWDFDVIKGDVAFTVFRHKRPKEACSGSLTSLGEIPSCGVIANVDAVVVEKPRTCHDGESVQVRKEILLLAGKAWRNGRSEEEREKEELEEGGKRKLKKEKRGKRRLRQLEFEEDEGGSKVGVGKGVGGKGIGWEGIGSREWLLR